MSAILQELRNNNNNINIQSVRNNAVVQNENNNTINVSVVLPEIHINNNPVDNKNILNDKKVIYVKK